MKRVPTTMEIQRQTSARSQRREKLLKALEHCQKTELLLIPNRIAMRCIRSAKTVEARERLVLAAIWTATEDMRQMWSGQTRSAPKKHKVWPPKNVYVNSMARKPNWLERLFPSLF